MSTDLEADLRREFDAVGAPSGLTFSPESVLLQGKRTIFRGRIIAGGSAALAVVLVVAGASLMTRPDDRAAPQPATRTTTGIVRAEVGLTFGTFQVELNRDPGIVSNVKYSFVTLDGQRHGAGGSSSHPKPGQTPDATWGSGMVDGHPVTIGLVPSPARNLEVTFADGRVNGIGTAELKGTGYWMFAVDYMVPEAGANDTARLGPPNKNQEATRTAEIASISWSGATGTVDGIAGDKRLTGRVLNLDKSASVKVVLRPGDAGRTTVSGQVVSQIGGGASTFSSLTLATTGPSGTAVVTGRQPIVGVNGVGPPIAAGILPPGSSRIGVILTTDGVARPIIVSKRLPDGRMIFALKVAGTKATDPGKDSIKAVTWTNADGGEGRVDVTQKQS
jgi:hypothetical protein